MQEPESTAKDDALLRTQAVASQRLTAMWRYRGMVSGILAGMSCVAKKMRDCDYVMARSDLLGLIDSLKSDFANAVAAEGDPESSRIAEDTLMAERYNQIRMFGVSINGRRMGIDELDAFADKLIAGEGNHD